MGPVFYPFHACTPAAECGERPPFKVMIFNLRGPHTAQKSYNLSPRQVTILLLGITASHGSLLRPSQTPPASHFQTLILYFPHWENRNQKKQSLSSHHQKYHPSRFRLFYSLCFLPSYDEGTVHGTEARPLPCALAPFPSCVLKGSTPAIIHFLIYIVKFSLYWTIRINTVMWYNSHL